MKILYFIIIFFISLVMMIVMSPLRGHPFGMGYSSLVGFTVFFYLTLFSLKQLSSKLSVWQILFAVILGIWLIQLPLRITDFESSVGSLPDVLIHTLGIMCGYFYWRLKKPLDILIFALLALTPVFMYFQGYDLWFHKLNHGTFTGKVNAYNFPIKFETFDEQKNLISDNNFQNKIVLLDFWTTSCGICFQKFPQLQNAYNQYKSDSSVLILAVNSPIEEDKPNQAFKMISERKYSFPVVVTKDRFLAEKYGITGFPATFVINQNGQVVYRGDIEGAIKTVSNLKN